MNSSLVVLKLDEERYAVDSSNAYSKAEIETQRACVCQPMTLMQHLKVHRHLLREQKEPELSLLFEQ